MIQNNSNNKIRIRLNPENRNQFRNMINQFGQSKSFIPFYDVMTADKIDYVYYYPETEHSVPALLDPVLDERIHTKAQSVSPD